ncbi:MAG: type III-B CRISPR-associated protein Cas10/Cmr2 [Anaerolineae bacterium]
MSNTYLHLIQIGPVQSFIAAARRTQDLYVGSRLLSMIAAEGVRAAQRTDPQAELLFPVQDERGNLPQSVPHRFAFLSDREPVTLARAVEQAVKDYWKRTIAGRVRHWLHGQIGDGEWTVVFDRQVENWLEVYCVAVPYDEHNHGASYQKATEAMSARKQARHFPQVNEPGRKCTLTGAHSALSDRDEFWQGLRQTPAIRRYEVTAGGGSTDNMVLRRNERLGALALIKRLAVLAGALTVEGDPNFDDDRDPRFPSTNHVAGWPSDAEPDHPLYLAVLHMDGDKMGERLANQHTKAAHQQLSRALAVFARTTVPALVNKYDQGDKGRTVLIYAGGDDVLALLPLPVALDCANDIQQAFAAQVGGTMSAGIAITSAGMPLDFGLDEARHAEKRAKEFYGRNAVAVRDVRSSAIRETGGKWDSGIITLVKDLQAAFEAGWLSGKLGYDLLEVSDVLDDGQLIEARQAEAKRLLKRHSEKAPEEKRAKLAEDLAAATESLGMADVARWVVLSRFLAKGGQR